MLFEGLDTETINGYARTIATSQEYINVNSFDDILDFLFSPQYSNSTFMLWNIRYDVQSMIKYLLLENIDNWRDIAINIQKNGYNYNGYKLFYIPNKLFKIKHNKRMVVFYDTSQYYDYQKLDNMSKKYLSDHKKDNAHWIDKSISYTKGEITLKELEKYYHDNIDLIGKYCMDDANLTKRLTDFIRSSFEMLNFSFNRPVSVAKLAENHIFKNYLYPRITDGMQKSHDFAKNSFHGGIFESRIRGYLKQPIYNYDINSAYPTTLSELEHLANGFFRWVEKPTKDKSMGWYLTDFDCKYIAYKKNIPFYQSVYIDDIEYKIELSKTSSYYPTGFRRQIITGLELDFLKRNGYFNKVIGGLEWYKETDKYDKPFGWIPNAYIMRRDIKLKDKDDIRQLTLKKMYNSCFGKTAQQKHGYSRMTNFYYASYTTSDTSTKIAQIAHDNERRIIEIATDGVYSTKKIKGLKMGAELGEWEFKEFEKGLFLGSGMKQLYYDSKNYETYIRGISNDRRFNLIEVLKKYKNDNTILFNKSRPIQLNECIMHVHKKSLHDLNTFQDVGRRLSVNTDKKHLWSKEYKSFKELLRHKSYATSFNVKEIDANFKEVIT